MPVATESRPPIEVFCCYSREDEESLKELETHLSLLAKQGRILFQHDQLIDPGADRAKAIDQYLEDASVILLLVSASFLACNYYNQIEYATIYIKLTVTL